MIRLSKRTEYGLIAATYLSKSKHPVSASEISRQFEIPRELLAKILQKMTRAGIINSIQGSQGGYTLAKKEEEITLSDFIVAIDGPISITSCTDDDNLDCERIEVCNIHSAIKKLQPQFRSFFKSITLRDFIERSYHV